MKQIDALLNIFIQVINFQFIHRMSTISYYLLTKHSQYRLTNQHN